MSLDCQEGVGHEVLGTHHRVLLLDPTLNPEKQLNQHLIGHYFTPTSLTQEKVGSLAGGSSLRSWSEASGTNIPFPLLR